MDHSKPSASTQAGSHTTPAASATPAPLLDAEAEVDLFSRYETEIAAAECLIGCDYSDGPLAAGGCHW